MKTIDYLIVGSGLYGALYAYKVHKAGKKCLVLERRSHKGGNLYCESIEGINVHKYGAHIFHTSNSEVWNFVNLFVEFNRFTNSPIAIYKDQLYNLPFNMNTFYSLWGVKTPSEAKRVIKQQREASGISNPRNLEEQAISLVGKDVYEILIKGYTEKQWGRKCTELPPFIIQRIPVRFNFDNNYFNDCFQGIPIGGYNKLIEGLLEGIECKVNVDFLKDREEWEKIASNIIFTGCIDEYYNYKFGKLEYRSLHFEEEVIECDNFQGNAVVNYTENEIPYTRIIEHKHFEFGKQPKTVLTREYPIEWKSNKEPFYPINDQKNNALYQCYKALAEKEKKVHFGGRLAEYKYYDMAEIVEQLLNLKL